MSRKFWGFGLRRYTAAGVVGFEEKWEQLGATGSETRFNAMWQACRFPNSCTAQALLLSPFLLHAYLLTLIDRKLSLHTVVLTIINCTTVPVLAEICDDELVSMNFFVADFGHRLRGVRGEGTEVGLLTRRQRTGCWDARRYHSMQRYSGTSVVQPRNG